MKTKALQLSIPQPCKESWDDMKSSGEGRHCTNCNKTIIDFSLYSDKQLLEFIKKSKDQLCGRLSVAQVNRPIFYAEPQNHFLHKLLFGSALTIGIACSANANYNPNQKPLIEQYELIKDNSAQEQPTGDSTKKAIEGVVMDADNNEPLPFCAVAIILNGQVMITATSDINGRFQLKVPDSLAHNKLTLLATCLGYNELKKDIVPSKIKSNINLGLKASELHIVGMMIYSPPADLDPTHQTWRKGDRPLHY